MRVLVALVLVVILSACTDTPQASRGEQRIVPAPARAACVDDPTACRGEPEVVGRFDARRVPEASGLAASRRNPGLWYLLDDGTEDQVWVMRRRGRLLGSIQVEGMTAFDPEALAVGACEPGATATCVYVADIGDNLRTREAVRVWRVREPDLAGGLPREPVAVDVVTLTYPDRPHNAEALLVDAHGRLGIVTKAPFDEQRQRTGPTLLFMADGFEGQTLRAHGRVRLPEPAELFAAALVGNVVTGGDAVRGRVLLRTYDAVYELTAPRPNASLATLAGWVVRELPARRLAQGEAIAYDARECGWATVGEQVGDIVAVRCQRPD